MLKSSLSITVKELQEAQASPLPKEILVHETVDSSGEDALEVIFVFPNSFTDDQLRWKNLQKLETAAREQLGKKDARHRFVYFRARRTKEVTPADRA